MQKASKKPRKSRFTVVDVCIVIVVVAFIVGGIVVGQDILSASGR